MKRLLLIVLPLLFIVGCSKPINEESLIERGGVKYQQDSQKPYSGKTFKLYNNGNKDTDGNWKDGVMNGKWTYWYENGQKEYEKTYKDGKPLNGLQTYWYENGQMSFKGTFEYERPHGLVTKWYENGQKESEGTYMDGELISEKVWYLDGTLR